MKFPFLLSFLAILNQVNAYGTSTLLKRPTLFIALTAVTYVTHLNVASAYQYENYYAIKYRQTRFRELYNSCNKRKRNIENRRCYRRCSSDSDCRGSKRKCLCDGECGLSCIRISTSCSQVGQFRNGFVTYSPDNLFGSQLVYACNPGFTLIGNKIRNCEGDGWWSGSSPSCIKEVFCSVPPGIVNAIVNVQMSKESTYKIGTEVEYQCDIGYVANGETNKVYCEETQNWSDSRFQCSRITCGKPKSIDNGVINGHGYYYSDVVEYRCTAGYRIRNGDYLRECSLDGTWSGIEPSCEPIDCGDPPIVKNSIINYDRTIFGSYAHYTCISDNYALIGAAHLNCLPNGKWNKHIPECIEKNCTLDYAEYSKPIYKIFSSNQPLFQYIYPLDTELRFLCQPGYELLGPSHSTCVKSRTSTSWSSSLPKCQEIKYCEALKSPENGQITTDTPATSKGYQQNTTLEFSCLQGYRLFGSELLTCSSDAKWLGDLPYCIADLTTTTKPTSTFSQTLLKRSCELSSIDLSVTYSENESSRNNIADSDNFAFAQNSGFIEHERSSGYYCKDDKSTHYVARCLNGKLFMEKNCDELIEKRTQCPTPPQLANGYNKFGSFMHGSKVYYQCFTGYNLDKGDKMLYCNNGKWIGDTPSCIKISCGYPGKLHGGQIMYIGTLDEYPYKPYMKSVGQDKQIRYECDSGYNLIGPTGSTCINGNWKPNFNLVSCIKDTSIIEVAPIKNQAFAAPSYQHQRFLQPEFEAKKKQIIDYSAYKTSDPTDNLIRKNRYKARRRLRLLRKKKLLVSEGSGSNLLDNISGRRKQRRFRIRKRRKQNHFSERRVFNYYSQA